jgi:hypothetical protein
MGLKLGSHHAAPKSHIGRPDVNFEVALRATARLLPRLPTNNTYHSPYPPLCRRLELARLPDSQAPHPSPDLFEKAILSHAQEDWWRLRRWYLRTCSL